MFVPHSDQGYTTPAPGVQLKTLTHGARTLMAKFRLQQGSRLPAHAHPHEQTGYLVSGHIVLTIGDRDHDVRPGDSWCIAGDVEHSAQVLEDSVAFEVFSPVREDLLPAT